MREGLQALQAYLDELKKMKPVQHDKRSLAMKLQESEFADWLGKVRSLLGFKLREMGKELLVNLEKSVANALQSLKATPAIADEVNFRKAMSKTSQAFASQSVALSQQAQELQSVIHQLDLVNLSGMEGWHVHTGAAQGQSQVLSTLVTVFAAMTLLRSPLAGTKTEEGKKTSRQLESLLTKLVEKDLPKTPASVKLPDDSAKQLLEEMVVAAPLPQCLLK